MHYNISINKWLSQKLTVTNKDCPDAEDRNAKEQITDAVIHNSITLRPSQEAIMLSENKTLFFKNVF